MGNASEWAVRLKAFHEKQLDRPRKVYRIGRTKLVVTGGQAASTVGAAVATASVDSPSWLFLAVPGCSWVQWLPGSSVESTCTRSRAAVSLPGAAQAR